MKITIPARFMAAQWDYPTWDAAYNIINRAAAGEKHSIKFLDDLKLGAAAGNGHAVRVKAGFDAAAGLVTKGLPKPSVFVAQHRRRSPLLPGAPGTPPATRPPVADGRAAALARKQAEEIKALKRQQLERAKKEQQRRQVQARFAAEKAAHEDEIARTKEQLAAVQKVLERRDIADEMRAQLEAQAEGYEALIDKLQTPGAAAEPATTSEAMAAEQPEAAQDDAAEAYPSGAPGDVEFNNAGT